MSIFNTKLFVIVFQLSVDFLTLFYKRSIYRVTGDMSYIFTKSVKVCFQFIGLIFTHMTNLFVKRFIRYVYGLLVDFSTNYGNQESLFQWYSM